MECNNTYCYWRMCDTCCHEDENVHGNENLQKPNQLDCPSALRSDFEEMLWGLYDWLYDLFEKAGIEDKEKLKQMNFRKLLDTYNCINRIWELDEELHTLKRMVDC